MIKYLAIIPARSGSKGFPGKNKHLLAAKPMVQYTIEAAQASRIDFVLLSSDDVDIIQIGKSQGIHVPFVRPAHLSNDTATQNDVIKHALEWFQGEYKTGPHSIILLQPTSPLRTADDIDRALDIYESRSLTSLISVCKVSQHPAECLLENQQGKYQFIDLQQQGAGRQSYASAYFIDGGIYISETNRFLQLNRFYSDDTYLFEIARSHAIDIDDPFGMYMASAILHYAESVDRNILNA